ncbi:MAG: hypothetical protein IPQ02_02565 [Saprospiraceae bacterium]|uniref:Immunity MXAN-0049 protein domain-containing protein n=1 Tax=Candidatus Defluviibacterium haderslevense TaxID=2981993 RepID=A0A9D7SBN7_9BACT|nr:hypothetical protein [Candidatus Defluviibacterium haderslevense]MBL0235516.1 hypothetical protein [Candidatus Defluviibacterium haderslevense]
MKYYTIDFDYENYPNGSAIDRTGGELRENEEVKEIFWSHFYTRLPIGHPEIIPKFHFINYRKARKFLHEDYLDDLYSIGILISERMKKIIECTHLPTHLFIPATIKFKEKYFENFWYFCLTSANINAIDYKKSYFFLDDGKARNTPLINYNKYASQLIKFDNEEILYKEMYKNEHPICAYKICLYNDKQYDVINFGGLISPFILFSEKIVEQFQSSKMTNCVFREYILVN